VLIPPPPLRLVRGGDVLAAGVERSTAVFRGTVGAVPLPFWRRGFPSRPTGVMTRDVGARLEVPGERRGINDFVCALKSVVELRALGKSDLAITPVGVGTAPIGSLPGTWWVNWGPQNENDAVRAIHAALDAGVN
jgi:hypothetical protein